MQDDSSKVVAVLKAERLSQAALAKKAKVSQATVSRILRNEPDERHGEARKRLMTYVESILSPKGFSDVDIRTRILVAFDKVWDKTPEHAELLIDALLYFGSAPSKIGRGKRR